MILVGLLLAASVAVAQQPSDAIYWCNVSRSQISIERDASLAQIEVLKAQNATLQARVKDLEAKGKE